MKNKAVIWGHKLGSHSHSYIHWGFYRAFEYLGYDVYWLDDNDDISSIDLSDSLFLTEGQVCAKMPRRKDSVYFLHNCEKMDGLGKYINIQYYHKDCMNYEHVAHGIAVIDDCILFPWGSPLLPEEFDESDLTRERGNDIYYLGTVNNQKENGGNYSKIMDFAEEAFNDGHKTFIGGGYTGNIKNKYLNNISGWIKEEDHISYYKNAYMTPALQGDNQLINGMIPCRLFKAISYGNDGITNNDFARDFFYGNVLYKSDARELYHFSESRTREISRKKWLFNFVKENHTYLNNINAMLQMI